MRLTGVNQEVEKRIQSLGPLRGPAVRDQGPKGFSISSENVMY